MFNFLKKNKRIKAPFINKKFFDTEVFQNKQPALIMFSASWCGACKMQKPLIHNLANDYKESNVLVTLVDIDSERELSQEFGIQALPTIIAIKAGSVLFRKVGLISRRELEKVMLKLQS